MSSSFILRIRAVDITLKLAEKQQSNEIADIGKGKNLPRLSIKGFDTLIEPSLYNLSMLEGICPRCGAHYYGWSLRFPRHQTCILCSVGLKIIEDGQVISEGYSPFTAERYDIQQPTNVPLHDDKKKGKRV